MRRGIVYILLASVAYGIMPVFSSQLLRMGMNAQSIVVFRFLFAASGAYVLLCGSKTPIKVTGKQLIQLILFGLFGYGATAFLLTSSYQYLPIGLATMFHFSYPLFVTAIMATLYHERMTAAKLLAILCGLGGMGLMAGCTGEIRLQGVLLAVCSGLTYAVFVVANKKSAFRDLQSLVVVFYTTATLTICFLFQALLSKRLILPPTSIAWGCCIAVGWFCSLFALCMLNKAIRTIGATYAAIGNMLEPLTSLLAGALVFGDQISLYSIAGCGLVLVAVLLVSADGRSSRKIQKLSQRSI